MKPFGRLFRFFLPNPRTLDAQAAYAGIMQQARAPQLYGAHGAPDNFDGRFDILALHIHFVLRRLRAQASRQPPDAAFDAAFGQALFDTFFADMDQAMRESGVGDLGVSKKIRKMAQAFYGRAQAYDIALDNAPDNAMDNAPTLKDILARNLFPDAVAEHDMAVTYLAAYALRLEAYLSEAVLENIIKGRAFPVAHIFPPSILDA